jgi:hypothetical protein
MKECDEKNTETEAEETKGKFVTFLEYHTFFYTQLLWQTTFLALYQSWWLG